VPTDSLSPHERFLTDRSQRFGDDYCFLCGKHIPPGSAERTQEHVFPKWLLHEMDLWNSSVTQINGRPLRYRQLTVPCCATCNSVDLSGVETRVRTAVAEGLNAFAALDPLDLFLWLGKIYYGLVYRESLQPLDLRSPDGPRLVPHEHLASIEFHHFLLQAAAGLVTWAPSSRNPATFHIFECLDSAIPQQRFDYLDELFVPVLGMRLGTIGVVAVLQDWGRSDGVQQPHLDMARTFALHPTQFREVFVRLAFMTTHSWKNLTHLVVSSDGIATVLAPSEVALDGSYTPGDLAPKLAEAWGVPVHAIFDGKSGMSTIGGPAGATPVSMNTVFTAAFDGQGLWPFRGFPSTR